MPVDRIIKNRWESAICELRDILGDDVEEGSLFSHDLYLLRWLKVTRLDVSKAVKLIRETLAWRKENKVDELVNRDYHPELFKLIPIHTCYCRNGMPVAFMHAGHMNVKDLLDEFGRRPFYEFIVQYLAKEDKRLMDWNLANYSGGEITENSFKGGLFMADYNNISLRQMMSFGALSMIIRFNTDSIRHFPLIATKWVAINCSEMTLPLVNLTKKIVEGPNLSVQLYDSQKDKWENTILKWIDASQLPVNFGGNLVVPGF